jgi:hypothetical protein
MADAPMTVVETARFLKDVKPIMSDSEREQLEGVRGRESGGRCDHPGDWRRSKDPLGLGRPRERGGARVIYYYHDECLPVFLLAAYGKNEKANLSMAERNAMKRLISVLVEGYPARDRRAR